MFIAYTDYTVEDTLYLEAAMMDANSGIDWGEAALSVALPELESLPTLQSADGSIVLSQLGLQVHFPGMFVVDEVSYMALAMTDGARLVVLDESSAINQTLYALGGDNWAFVTYVLAVAPELDKVEAVVINDVAYPLT